MGGPLQQDRGVKAVGGAVAWNSDSELACDPEALKPSPGREAEAFDRARECFARGRVTGFVGVFSGDRLKSLDTSRIVSPEVTAEECARLDSSELVSSSGNTNSSAQHGKFKRCLELWRETDIAVQAKIATVVDTLLFPTPVRDLYREEMALVMHKELLKAPSGDFLKTAVDKFDAVEVYNQVRKNLADEHGRLRKYLSSKGIPANELRADEKTGEIDPNRLGEEVMNLRRDRELLRSERKGP